MQAIAIPSYVICIQVCFLEGCQPGSVRLAGGPTAQEGRIELCVQSSLGVTIWGSVCNPQNYGVSEIVCRQLNYSRSGIWFYCRSELRDNSLYYKLMHPVCSIHSSFMQEVLCLHFTNPFCLFDILCLIAAQFQLHRKFHSLVVEELFLQETIDRKVYI